MKDAPTIKREELVSALAHLKPAIDNKETAAQSSCVLFLGDRLVADNEILHIEIPFQSGIYGAVKAEELIQVLNKSNSPVLSMEVDKGHVIFKSGRSRTGLQLSAIIRDKVIEFDPEQKSGGKISEDFLKALDLTSSCCTDDLNERALSAINVTKDHLIGCDNFQSMMCKVTAPKIAGVKQILIPAFAVPAIIGIQADTLSSLKDLEETFFCAMNSKTKEKVYFEAIDRVENPYPDLDFIFESEDGEDFVFPDGAVEAINKAEIFAKNSLKNEEVCVSIIIENNAMKVYGEGANGFYEESFDYDGDDNISFIVIPKTLSAVIGKKASVIKIIKNDPPRILFMLDDYTYGVNIEVEENKED